MHTTREPQKRIRLVGTLKRLPVFYRTLVILFCMVLLMVTGIHINNWIFEKRLTENYLQLAEGKLQQNCDALFSAIYNTYAIPHAIENTSYFNYVRVETSGVLPDKYVSVLPLFRKALSNQVYLQGENVECLLYFSGTNSIVSRAKVFQYAQDCFDTYIHMSEKDSEELFQKINKAGVHELLPVQNVTIGKNTYESCWAFVVRPYNSSIAAVSFYPMERILDALDIDALPEDTVLTIDTLQGNRLASYPEKVRISDESDCYPLKVKDTRLSIVITLYIPKSYFEEQTQQIINISLMITLAISIVAIGFALLMSRFSSKPIQRLVKTHGQNVEGIKQSEEEILEQILNENKQVQQQLHERLASSLLARLFASAILSERETKQLAEYMISLQWPCQVAVMYVDGTVNLLQMCEYIRLTLCGNIFCQPISAGQIGIILSGNYENIATLKSVTEYLQEESPKISIRCGVSSTIDLLEQVHIAIHQARMAVPKEPGFAIFAVNNTVTKASLSWLQHERLYQSLVEDDRKSAETLLQMIAMEPYRGTAAREAYYNILFVLRSAAAQLNIELQEIEMAAYDQSVLPWKNIQKLQIYITMLFDRINEQKNRKEDDTKQKIMELIAKNFADCNLCAATVAHEFILSEKRIYSIVREKTGMSFNEYLLSVRMKHAGYLLCTTSQSTGEIALQCGYQAESTFYRVFKRYFGKTPGEYRQSGGVVEDAQFHEK